MINDGHDLSLDNIRRSRAQPGSLKRRGSASLLCDIESAVVNGQKLEGDDLRKWIEGMSEQDRRTLIEDMGLVDMLKTMKGPTPCSHCGGNGYEP